MSNIQESLRKRPPPIPQDAPTNVLNPLINSRNRHTTNDRRIHPHTLFRFQQIAKFILILLAIYVGYTIIQIIFYSTDDTITSSNIEIKPIKESDLTKDKPKDKGIELINHTLLTESPFGFLNYPDKDLHIVDNEKLKLMGYKRIVAIGDLHGDLNQCKKILQLTNVIDKNDNWIAKPGTIVVQTGDIFDRGEYSVQVLQFWWELRQKAVANNHNGRVFQILGNHEHLNLNGEYHYVHQREVYRHGGKSGWRNKLSLDHAIGWFLRQTPIIRIIGNTLFVHAGLRPEILKVFNNNITKINDISHSSINIMNFNERNYPNLFYDSITILGNEGPIWTREFEPRFYNEKLIKMAKMNSDGTKNDMLEIVEEYMCNQVSQTLNILNLKRMVIGHNVQSKGFVTETCDGKLYKIDVGLSYAYGSQLGAIQIDIENDLVSIISP